jgi:hypothetical protein
VPSLKIDFQYPDGRLYKTIYTRYIINNNEIRINSVSRYLYAETGHCVREYVQYRHPALIFDHSDMIELVIWYDNEVDLGGWCKGYFVPDNKPATRQIIEAKLSDCGVKSFILDYIHGDTVNTT